MQREMQEWARPRRPGAALFLCSVRPTERRSWRAWELINCGRGAPPCLTSSGAASATARLGAAPGGSRFASGNWLARGILGDDDPGGGGLPSKPSSSSGAASPLPLTWHSLHHAGRRGQPWSAGRWSAALAGWPVRRRFCPGVRRRPRAECDMGAGISRSR